MRIVKYITVLLFTFSFIEGTGQAPSVFSFTPTGTNHTIFIKKASQPSINNEPLQPGDLIGVFFDTPNGLKCGGYTQWSNENTFITAYGADSTADGFKPGEVFKYMILRNSTECIIDHVEVTYETGGIILNTDSFEDNGISSLGSLMAKDYLFKENFDVWVTNATCRGAGGKVEVIAHEDEAIEGLEIVAKGILTRNDYQGHAEIAGMDVGSYKLTFQRNGCIMPWPDDLIVSTDPNCDFPVISPDRDGNAEDYYIPYQGTAKIYDRYGVLMTEIPIPSTWDATDNDGNLLPMGTYAIVCEGQEPIMITIVR
jgi:hypothetical protein